MKPSEEHTFVLLPYPETSSDKLIRLLIGKHTAIRSTCMYPPPHRLAHCRTLKQVVTNSYVLANTTFET